MSYQAYNIVTLVRSVSYVPLRVCKWATNQNLNTSKPVANSNGCWCKRGSQAESTRVNNAEAQESLTDYYNSS